MTLGQTLLGVKASLTATYINASFVPMLDFSKGARKVKATVGDSFTFKTYRKSGFRIGGGVYAGYTEWAARANSSTRKMVTETGQRRAIISTLEDFRYGVRGQLGFGSFRYVRSI